MITTKYNDEKIQKYGNQEYSCRLMPLSPDMIFFGYRKQFMLRYRLTKKSNVSVSISRRRPAAVSLSPPETGAHPCRTAGYEEVS